MKRILAIVTGVVTGFVIVFIGDATTHALSPLPTGIDHGNRDQMREYIASIPIYVLTIMTLFWLGSSFLGGMVSALINRSAWKRVSLITGSILMAATILNLAMLPHSGWMWVLVIIGYLPAALFGGWLVRPKVVTIS